MTPAGRGATGPIVAAQVLTQIGAFTLPALLPGYIARWQLSGAEAGWLVGIFFAAYVVAVPVLLAMTDRLPVRRVYLLGAGLTVLSHLGFALLADGFWLGLLLRAVAGIGWAGAYMPGLKAIADPLEGAAQSRAVSLHAAGIGIAGAVSFALAARLDAVGGPRLAFLAGAATAAGAFTLPALLPGYIARWQLSGAVAGIGWAGAYMPGLKAIADPLEGEAQSRAVSLHAAGIGIAGAVLFAPAALPRRANAPAPGSLLDFRPVFANRAAMAWIIGYTVHTWEFAVLRAWAVTFLTVTVARNGAPEWLPAPAVMFTVAALAGGALSVSGNELAQRFGRYRVVLLAMGWGLGFGHLAVVTLGGLVAVRYLTGVYSGAPSPGAGISS